MKKLIVILAMIASSCCDKRVPQKETSLSILVKKDTSFVKNIKKIYAFGSNLNNSSFEKYQSSTFFDSRNVLSQLILPISYAADSTIYVMEHKNKVNDTITVFYQRNVDYDGSGKCGYLQTLSSNTKRKSYSTLRNYNLDVSFGTFNSSSACSIILSEK